MGGGFVPVAVELNGETPIVVLSRGISTYKRDSADKRRIRTAMENHEKTTADLINSEIPRLLREITAAKQQQKGDLVDSLLITSSHIDLHSFFLFSLIIFVVFGVNPTARRGRESFEIAV
jgi:hypothetical protein